MALPNSNPTVRPAPPRRLHFGLLTLAFAGFAIYGSLVPLNYTPLEWTAAVERFRQISWLELGVVHRADWVANILLFVPLGFLGLASTEVDQRPGLRTGVVVLLSLAIWSALSLSIEFTQLWFPPRTVSLNDLIAESIGAVLGMVLWMACGQRATEWFRRATTEAVGENLYAILLPGYLVFLAVTHWMPLDLSISPAELYDKYRSGKILLIPFTPPHNSWSEALYKYVWNVVFFFPVGWLWAQLPLGGRLRHGPGVTLGLGLSVTGLIELGQMPVLSRFTDITDLFTGTLAVMLGWVVARQLSPASESARSEPSAPTGGARVAWRQLAFWGLGLAAWLGVVVWFYWGPFDFRLDPKQVAARLENLSLIPFFDYYRQSEFKSFDNVLRRTVVFLPVGVALGMMWLAIARRASIYWPLPVAVALVGVIEVAQFFLPDKTPSVTDGLLGSCGAWLGLYVVRRVFGGANSPPGTGRAGGAPEGGASLARSTRRP